jgi:hypothetical protein
MSALTIRRIGWAGYVITTEAGTRIVVDPFLHGSERGVRLPDSPITVDELADADIVAVTHAGYDQARLPLPTTRPYCPLPAVSTSISALTQKWPSIDGSGPPRNGPGSGRQGVLSPSIYRVSGGQ